ncbi:MAG: DinB family protein [Gammaproteobacteria bacterium]|nr:DinB family protein [Gammaproteobacteria bacterium]
MLTRKEFLLTQLRACHNQNGWFAPLNVALRELTTDLAVQRRRQSTNSILGIVHHLVFYNERYLQRFKQDSVPKIVKSIAETFEYNDSGEIAEVWDDLRNKLDNLFAQWEEAIIKCEDAKLDSQTPDSDELWWSSLAHLAIHNAYHIGQIVYIRKEQGLWETWED